MENAKTVQEARNLKPTILYLKKRSLPPLKQYVKTFSESKLYNGIFMKIELGKGSGNR